MQMLGVPVGKRSDAPGHVVVGFVDEAASSGARGRRCDSGCLTGGTG